jgi:hypothetical protein
MPEVSAINVRHYSVQIPYRRRNYLILNLHLSGKPYLSLSVVPMIYRRNRLIDKNFADDPRLMPRALTLAHADPTMAIARVTR